MYGWGNDDGQGLVFKDECSRLFVGLELCI